jgi:hypothetical protein
VQTLKRGKTAKIAKAVADEEEEDEAEETGGATQPGAESAMAAEAAAIRSEALEEKQLAQQQRVSEVCCYVSLAPRAFWLGGVCKGGQLSEGRRAWGR